MYVIKYNGPFGYIKPPFAVRDKETMSQQFLSQSTLVGMEMKLFPELLKEEPYGEPKLIKGYRLSFDSIDMLSERIKSMGDPWVVNKKDNRGNIYLFVKNVGVLSRGTLINPVLHLFISEKKYADRAYTQTLCLCRNEDLLFPTKIMEVSESALDRIKGFELEFTKFKGLFVGYNRYTGTMMFGNLKTY